MIRIAMYQPDIPQNLGAAMRLCACLGVPMDVIEPCGFPFNEPRIRRGAMDYGASTDMTRHASWDRFIDAYQGKARVILLTTRAELAYTAVSFRPGDILLAGRESAGVPEEVHGTADMRVTIPMPGGGRSLNVVNSLAMVAGEALRQLDNNELFCNHEDKSHDIERKKTAG